MSALRWGFDRKAGARKRPVPLVRAYRGSWPILAHRTMAEVMADEIHANARDETGVVAIAEAPAERVSRPVAGRSAAATSEIMDVTAGETAPVSHPVRAMPPKPVSAPVAEVAKPPLPDQPAPARDPSPKLALGDAPSGMEDAARQWIKPPSLVCTVALPPVPDDNAKVWCSGCDARVPAWFGRDCISARCDLKGRA